MIVCLTGKIGSGKTTSLEHIKSLHIPTFEMDKYIHDIYKVNCAGYNLIKRTFGSEYVNEFEVNRKKLGTLVFNNPKKLDQLNSLMLPIMRSKILELKEQYKDSLIVVELAIYINHELYFNNIFDYIIQLIPDFGIENKKLKDLSWFKNKHDLKDPIKSIIINDSIIVKNNSTIAKLKENITKTINGIIEANKM